MKVFISIITVFGLLFCTSPMRADVVKKIDRISASIDANAGEQTEVLMNISHDTGVPVETLKMQRAQTGLGYGGLLIANSLASATGRTFAEIAALKASGQGWGEIAKSYHLKLKPFVKQAHQLNKAITSLEKSERKIAKEKIDNDKIPEEKAKKEKTKKDKSDDDFFTDHDNGAVKDSDVSFGKNWDKGQDNASHAQKSQGAGQGKGKSL